jgi:putative oxidoreductase
VGDRLLLAQSGRYSATPVVPRISLLHCTQSRPVTFFLAPVSIPALPTRRVIRAKADWPRFCSTTEETIMTFSPVWARVAIIIARLIFAGVFAMSVFFKFMDINATAGYIASIGLPAALPLACLAALFELGLVLVFLTGAFFTEATLLAAAYVLFLAFAFHGPAHWAGNQMEFGFFTDHFTFIAGLLFAAVHGPGEVLALRLGLIRGEDHSTAAHA